MSKTSIRVPNFKIVLRSQDKDFILGKLAEVLVSNRWTAGKQNLAFEEAFKKFSRAPYAASVMNGGAGLVAVLEALKITTDSLVLCPTLTAPPTAQAILAAGMRVVFADSSPLDLGLDLEDVEKKLKTYKGRIKAVIGVHVAGWISPNIFKLKNLCKKYGVYLIEDCAHAAGSKLNGRPVGSAGIAAVYSLFMTKPLTCGEGGIVTSRDKSLIERIKNIRNYGKDKSDKHIISGFNYKLSEFNAAVAYWATVKGRRIIRQRQRMAKSYDKLIKGISRAKIFNVSAVNCSYYKYILVLDRGISRDKFKKILLQDYGIETAGGVYDTLCHQEPFFHSKSNKVLNSQEKFPQAEDFSQRQVCLPLYLGLTAKEQGYVAKSVLAALNQFKNND